MRTPFIEVVNITARMDLNRHINLNQLARSYPQLVSYDADSRAMFAKFAHLTAKVQIYQNGKLLFLGAKSSNDIVNAYIELSHLIDDLK